MAFVKAVIAFVLVAGTALTALRMWLRSRTTTRLDHEPQLDLLRQEHAQLRSDLEARLAEIEERVDFTERRMTQERSPQRLPGQTAKTPA